MGYMKNTWVDRIVQFPRRFRKSNEADDLLELTPEPGTVTAVGTPVNAALLNHMEQGIKDALPKDGSEPMTGPLQAPSLALSNYGTPLEIGRYIDMHKAGSSSDYDGRIYLGDNDEFIYAPASGAQWKLRNNGGILEADTGGGWRPVGGIATKLLLPAPSGSIVLGPTDTVFKTVFSYTGRGMLRHLPITINPNVGNFGVRLAVLIDGKVLYDTVNGRSPGTVWCLAGGGKKLVIEGGARWEENPDDRFNVAIPFTSLEVRAAMFDSGGSGDTTVGVYDPLIEIPG